jgi:hypothetical protein
MKLCTKVVVAAMWQWPVATQASALGGRHAPRRGVVQIRNERGLPNRTVRAQGPNMDQVGPR